MKTWMQNKTVLHNFKFDFKLIAYCEVTVVASVRVGGRPDARIF